MAFSLTRPLQQVGYKQPFPFLFAFGFLIKLVVILAFTPAMQTSHFLPFLEHTIHHFSLDPWSNFLAMDGKATVFPYGWGMLLVLLPFAFCSLNHGIGLALLFFDVALLGFLLSLMKKNRKRLIALYWFSPFVFVLSYVHGQLDLIPVTLLMGSLSLLTKRRPAWSGALFALSCSAKYSMFLVLPIILFFLLCNQRYRAHLFPFFRSFVILSLLFLLPISAGYFSMVWKTPEASRVFAFSLKIQQGTPIYVTVVCYLLLVYMVWFLKRMNETILFAWIGVIFSAIVILSAAPIGWLLWPLPIFLIHSARSSMHMRMTFYLYMLVLAFWAVFPQELSDGVKALSYSSIVALQLLLTIHLFIKDIWQNRFFRLTRTPLSIAIAGDSGTGKSLLSTALEGLFGARSVAQLSGDDYHRWDRFSPMWKDLTHLDSQANRLHEFSNDALALINGETVKHPHYDHETGRFTSTRQVVQREVFIFSGLHALTSAHLRSCLDLKVYLEMESSLRRHFKVLRDKQERGQNEAHIVEIMERREKDLPHLTPQKSFADIAFYLDRNENSDLRLNVSLRSAIYADNLARGLIDVCGLLVEYREKEGSCCLEIEGTTTPDRLKQVQTILSPELKDHLALDPLWKEGMLGIMQLICLVHINEAWRVKWK